MGCNWYGTNMILKGKRICEIFVQYEKIFRPYQISKLDAER